MVLFALLNIFLFLSEIPISFSNHKDEFFQLVHLTADSHQDRLQETVYNESLRRPTIEDTGLEVKQMERSRRLRRSLDDTTDAILNENPSARDPVFTSLTYEQGVLVWIVISYAAYVTAVLIFGCSVRGCLSSEDRKSCKSEYLCYVTLAPLILPVFLWVAVFWWIPKYCCRYTYDDKPIHQPPVEMSHTTPSAPPRQSNNPGSAAMPNYPIPNSGYAPAPGYTAPSYPAHPNFGYAPPPSNPNVSVTVVRA